MPFLSWAMGFSALLVFVLLVVPQNLSVVGRNILLITLTFSINMFRFLIFLAVMILILSLFSESLARTISEIFDVIFK